MNTVGIITARRASEFFLLACVRWVNVVLVGLWERYNAFFRRLHRV
jgi:hypothetical protein